MVPLYSCALLLWIVYPLYWRAVEAYQQWGRWDSDERIFLSLAVSVPRMLTCLAYHVMFFIFELGGFYEESRLYRKAMLLPSRELIFKTIYAAAFGMLLEPFLIYALLYPIMQFLGCPKYDSVIYGMDDSKNPSLDTWTYTFGVMLVCHVANTIIFYASHRLLHHPLFYARFHKQHHEYKGPISFMTEYAHPVETVFANLLSALLAPLLLSVHPSILIAFVLHKLKRSIEVHCSYALKDTIFDKLWLVNPEMVAFHDFHHSVNQGCFMEPHFDWWFGTMDHWAEQGGFEGYLNRKKAGKSHSYLHNVTDRPTGKEKSQ